MGPCKHGYSGIIVDIIVGIIVVDNSSYMHVDIKKKDTLVLGEGPTQGLDDTTITAEAKYPIDFTESRKRYVLSLYYDGSKSFLFVNTVKMYHFKANDSEINNIHYV